MSCVQLEERSLPVTPLVRLVCAGFALCQGWRPGLSPCQAPDGSLQGGDDESLQDGDDALWCSS